LRVILHSDPLKVSISENNRRRSVHRIRCHGILKVSSLRIPNSLPIAMFHGNSQRVAVVGNFFSHRPKALEGFTKYMGEPMPLTSVLYFFL
jgi:hypothetical protein